MRFLTMTDARFLAQAVVLARSLDAVRAGAELQILCLDASSRRALDALRLPGVVALDLAELESADHDLAATRSTRSWREYCWTCAPALCARASEQAPAGDVVVWLDADIELYADPSALLADLGAGSVLLVPHRYRRPYPSSAPGAWVARTYGPYNGGTIAFRVDAPGRAAAQLWRRRTLTWCGDRPEPGRFGNQLHLRDFPGRIAGTRVSRDPGIGLGPWNGYYRRWECTDGRMLADGHEAAFYHFQSLRLWRLPAPVPVLPRNLIGVPGRGRLVGRTTPWYGIAPAERELLWRPYLSRVAQARADVALAAGEDAAELPALGARELAHDCYHVTRLAKNQVTWRVIPEQRRIAWRRRRGAMAAALRSLNPQTQRS